MSRGIRKCKNLRWVFSASVGIWHNTLCEMLGRAQLWLVCWIAQLKYLFSKQQSKSKRRKPKIIQNILSSIPEFEIKSGHYEESDGTCLNYWWHKQPYFEREIRNLSLKCQFDQRLSVWKLLLWTVWWEISQIEKKFAKMRRSFQWIFRILTR